KRRSKVPKEIRPIPPPKVRAKDRNAARATKSTARKKACLLKNDCSPPAAIKKSTRSADGRSDASRIFSRCAQHQHCAQAVGFGRRMQLGLQKKLARVRLDRFHPTDRHARRKSFAESRGDDQITDFHLAAAIQKFEHELMCIAAFYHAVLAAVAHD